MIHRLLLFLCFGITVSAQSDKNLDAVFKTQDHQHWDISLLSQHSPNDTKDVYQVSSKKQSNSNTNYLSITIADSLDLYFEKSSLYATPSQIRTSENKSLSIPKDLLTYRGHLKNKAGRHAYLSKMGNKVLIQFPMDGKDYQIMTDQYGRLIGQYVLGNLTADIECHTASDLSLTTSKTSAPSKMIGDCLEVYLEVDHQAFLDNGSSTSNVMLWISSIMNNVARTYEIINIPIVISETFIWTTPDPYTSNSALTTLLDFKNQVQNNYNGRIALLMTTRDIGGGIADGVGGICGDYVNSPGPYAVLGNLESNITGLPVFNYSIYLALHELGHILGARHTHACVWNGNNTQIDDCGNVYAQQAGNFPEGAACFDDQNPILPASNGGTIMSRCHLNGTGIDLQNQFHPQVEQVIVSTYQNASCNTGFVCSTVRPSNDNCENAIPLEVTQSCTPELYDNYRATASGASPGFSCGNNGNTLDVWFSTTVSASGSLTIESSQISGGLNNTVVQTYTGTCGSLSPLACDDNSNAGNHAQITLSGLTPGETVYIRVIDSGSNDEGTFGLCVYDVNLPCHESYDDLIAIYNNTNGATWTNQSGWDQGVLGLDCNVCSWYGVSCNANNEVTRLQLGSNNLSGSLPVQTSNLGFLELLDISNNSVSGPLPSGFDNLDNLIFLDIHNNNFAGSLPSAIVGLANIAVLYLNQNNFTGPIPPSLGNLNLNILHLNDNNLSGCIPGTLDNYCLNGNVNLDNNPNLAGSGFQAFCATQLGADYDMDGFCVDLTGGDCLDYDPLTYPGAPELCDGIDNNCNGITDDGISQTNTYTGPASGDWQSVSAWSLGQVPLICHDVIINTGDQVTIDNSPAFARSILLDGSLINNDHLTILGSPFSGIQVNEGGLLTNNDSIYIDNINLYGIDLRGTSNNNGIILIDNAIGEAQMIIGPSAVQQNSTIGQIKLGQQ